VVRALALDVGSSSVRTAVVDDAGTVSHVHQHALTIRSPQPGEVELDPLEIANVALELAAATLRDAGPCDVVGVTNQRATTIVFDAHTGEPVGPALSWQDLRTVIDCLVLQERGLRLAPNQSATKVKWLVDQSGRPSRELRFATIETWIAWHLSERSTYVSDHSNASVSGLVDVGLNGWDQPTLDVLGVSDVGLPQLVSTMGSYGEASALAGSPIITALIGDQPASLFGQSCVRSGAKITFGTGAMLDMVHRVAPQTLTRYESGCYPTVVRSEGTDITWGVEGIILSAGSCVEWLKELGLLADVADSDALANSVSTTDGVSFVPAFSGLGTPRWDFGARGAFFGLTRGSSRANLVRAVLDGIAHRGADLLDAAEAEVGVELAQLRVDGGMSINRYFVQRLADFSGRVIAVSSEREATTRGAGLMALVGSGHLRVDDVEALWSPGSVLTPSLSDADRSCARNEWATIVERSARSIPALSEVAF
jgi:glycerol kinase